MAKKQMKLYFLSRCSHNPSPPIQKERKESPEEWKTCYAKQFTRKQAEPVFQVRRTDHTVILSDPVAPERKEKKTWDFINNVILPDPMYIESPEVPKSAWKLVNNVILPDPIRPEREPRVPRPGVGPQTLYHTDYRDPESVRILAWAESARVRTVLQRQLIRDRRKADLALRMRRYIK